MGLKRGSRVLFLNDVGGGEVVSVRSGGVVLVRTDEGFELPVLAEELIEDGTGESSMAYGFRSEEEPEGRYDVGDVWDEVYDRADVESLKRSAQSVSGVHGGGKAYGLGVESEPSVLGGPADRGFEGTTGRVYGGRGGDVGDQLLGRSEALRKEGGEHRSLYLGFEPADGLDVLGGDFYVWMINERQVDAFVTVAGESLQGVQTLWYGHVESDSMLCVGRVSGASIPELFVRQRCVVQAIFFSSSMHRPEAPQVSDVEVRHSRFLRPGAFQETRFSERPMLLIGVYDEAYERLVESLAADELEEELLNRKGVESSVPAGPEMGGGPVYEEVVLDLHIEQLVDGRVSMDAGAILAYQLRRFELGLEQALASKGVKRFVAIHGVGQGRLRAEVARCLREKYPGLEFQDASFKEYGYGATVIFVEPLSLRKH